MDVSDIELVVQFGVAASLTVWLQRAGRAGRAPDLEARAIMLVEIAVLQKGGPKKPSKKQKRKRTVEDQVSAQNAQEYKKNIGDDVRMWLETETCRRAVLDTYFNNPPRSHGKAPIDRCSMFAHLRYSSTTAPVLRQLSEGQ